MQHFSLFLGVEVETGSYFRAFGRFLIIQRDRDVGGNGGALSIAEVNAFCPRGPYKPGEPGGPWTDEEVLVVKEKIRYMVDFRNAKALYRDTVRFPKIVDEVFGNVWKPDDPSNKHWSNKTFWRSGMMIAPTLRKLIQLAFHDCLKNVDSDGNQFGGCDGCLNWEGMDDMNEVPRGHMGSTSPVWPSYRAQPIKFKTDNNKLSTTAMALEWIYTDPTWPPGPRELTSSLKETGKSRADLWQLAANTALEIEIAKANYACSHKVSYQQMVVALEGKEKCLGKLQEPVPFQYGRVDCIRDTAAASTDFPFEATNKESHSNPFGQGDWVLKDLKRDFGMPARQSIALMAVHAIAPEKHNRQLEIAYKWGGNPFLSNNYYKTLGSRPQYSLGAGIRLGGQISDGILIGDEFGRPLSREVQGDFQLTMKNWWNTSHPDAGPWFFRPMTVDTSAAGLDDSLKPRTDCFKYNYTTEAYDRLTRGWWIDDLCEKADINEETGVQTGGPAQNSWRSWGFSFYLPYEIGFVKNFTIDSQNHPRGCNFPEVYPEIAVDGDEPVIEVGRTPINCTRATFKLDGEEQTSADIVDEFADDHEVWAHAFIQGWQVTKFFNSDILCKAILILEILCYYRPFKEMVTMMAVSTTDPSRPGLDTPSYLKVTRPPETKSGS